MYTDRQGKIGVSKCGMAFNKGVDLNVEAVELLMGRGIFRHFHDYRGGGGNKLVEIHNDRHSAP